MAAYCRVIASTICGLTTGKNNSCYTEIGISSGTSTLISSMGLT